MSSLVEDPRLDEVLEGLLDEEGVALGLLVEGQHQGLRHLVLGQDGDELAHLGLAEALDRHLPEAALPSQVREGVPQGVAGPQLRLPAGDGYQQPAAGQASGQVLQ